MSGTSLDGLDLAYCTFIHTNNGWKYNIIQAETIPYKKQMVDFLIGAYQSSAAELIEKHSVYGVYIGNEVKRFLKKFKITVNLVASHGHTIFHKPQVGYTFQLGCGANIATVCGITTVSDFRSTDVANGGQGAPLVPVGDDLLFDNYDYCLNLGGFSNVSYQEKGLRIAFDICPVNIFINSIAKKKGKRFDAGGKIGSMGIIRTNLLHDLNNLAYYDKNFPKSLGREWFEQDFMPVVNRYNYTVEDTLRTAYEHFALQISQVLNQKSFGKVLITGGGAFNKFLVELIAEKSGIKIEIPDTGLVKYKEAMVFGFLGVLRYRNEINCYSSVTGARCNSSAGVINLASHRELK